MATFMMFGTYSQDALRQVSAKRTQDASALIKKWGGETREIYAMLGDRDLLVITDFPDNESAMGASLALSRATGISFSTCAAMPVDRFDALAAKN